MDDGVYIKIEFILFDLKWIYGPFKTLYTVNPTTNPSLSLCCIIFELALAAPSLASSTTCPHNQSRDPRYRCVPHHPQAQEQQQAAQGGRGEVLAARDSGGQRRAHRLQGRIGLESMEKHQHAADSGGDEVRRRLKATRPGRAAP
ncbi:hypothetical protein GQ55_5G336900 [Panicum hallii var. hallii]|uniref:Uncharacterized protein n=1 Tax=Panicum hallii var. hallii TaxID=1504633 RepID=A0A2T7DM00_9POAL|nr:hypothetical protein GQ55_5G336900 [Panicum hallii var. hallii]